MRTERVNISLTIGELKQILKLNISLTLKCKLIRKLKQLQNKNNSVEYKQLELEGKK